MRSATVKTAAMGVIGLASLLATAGCQSDRREPPGPDDPQERVLKTDPRNATRRVSFGDLPAPVRDAFRHENPRADVTDSGVTSTANGPVLYRVVYKRDGLPQEATYRADGSRVEAGMAETVSRPPPAPTNEPVIITPPPASR
jgi:hypothetical protein